MNINIDIFSMMCDKPCVYIDTAGVNSIMGNPFDWHVLFSGLISQLLVGFILAWIVNKRLKLMDITNNVIIHNKKTMIQLVDELFVNIQKFLYITRSHEMDSKIDDVINAMRDVDISINRIKLFDGMSDIYKLFINFRVNELNDLYNVWKDTACNVVEHNNDKSKLQCSTPIITNQHTIDQAKYDRLLNAYNSNSNINEKLALSKNVIKCGSDMLDNQRKLAKAYEDQIDIGNKITTTKLTWIQNTQVRELSYKAQLDELIVTLHEHFKKYESQHK